MFGAAAGGLCAALMVIVLKVYGTPYNVAWWLVMAIILVGACVTPRFLARPLEWVLDGYQEE